MYRRVPPAVHRLALWADQLSTAGESHTHCMNRPLFCLAYSGRLQPGLLCCRCGGFCVGPQRLTPQVEAVILLHYPVQNCIGNGGIPDPRMPVLNGQLTGDDGRLVSCTIITD